MVELQSALLYPIFRVSDGDCLEREKNSFCSFLYSSNRHQCLNNVPDHRSAVFKDLNDELKARELPGRFSDLNAQCRRAFGTNFEYCKDLSHGVTMSIVVINLSKKYFLRLAEMQSAVLPRNLY